MPDDLAYQLELGLRLLVAAVLGALIGIEREFHDHPAGMRTHLLVAVGSAAFTVLSVEAFPGPGGDAGRVAAQVVSGIGFLGAGAILKEGATVRGLTTAASLWAVAGVGMAAGVGAWAVAATVTAIVIVSLWPLRIVAERFIGRGTHRVALRLVADDPGVMAAALRIVAERGGEMEHLESKRIGGGQVWIDLDVRVPDRAARDAVVSDLVDLDGVDIKSSTGGD